MKINWFPGHMKKTLSVISQELKGVDFVIYILDARAPVSSLNPLFNNMFQNKSILFVFNKYDLADQDKINKFENIFNNKKYETLKLNSIDNINKNILINKIKSDIKIKKKIERHKDKNVNATIKVMVVGVPNSGKSTFINRLAGKYKAVTGNKPGVTKQKQWISIGDNIKVLDTPGTLWPDLENQVFANRLITIGSIRKGIFAIEELILNFLKDILPQYKNKIEKRYNIEISSEENAIDVFEKIAKTKNFYIRNKEIDYTKTAELILNDFQSGRLSKITLDSPKDFKND
ncbi:MAG: ribosome biogenesis GTPase YlqF [Candidatus Woesearchaeota archaeon]